MRPASPGPGAGQAVIGHGRDRDKSRYFSSFEMHFFRHFVPVVAVSRDGFQIVLARHEGGAGYLADGSPARPASPLRCLWRTWGDQRH